MIQLTAVPTMLRYGGMIMLTEADDNTSAEHNESVIWFRGALAEKHFIRWTKPFWLSLEDGRKRRPRSIGSLHYQTTGRLPCLPKNFF